MQLSDYASIISKALPHIEKGLKEAFSNSSELSKELFMANFTPLDNGIESVMGGIDYGKPNAVFQHQLKTNAGVFAAFKAHNEQKELIKHLVDKDGKLRSFSAFRKATKDIVKDYHRNHLVAEYNAAVRSARMGEKWQDLQANKDLYPNLEYIPSRSAVPREDHKPFYGIIKPIDDPFWKTHYPPNGWGCLCGAKSTDKKPTDHSTKDIPPPTKPFDLNVGEEAKIFDDSHPYLPEDIEGSKTYKKLIGFLAPIQSRAISKDSSLWKDVELPGGKSFMLNKKRLTTLTNKPHKNRLLRNEVVIQLGTLAKDAKLAGIAEETKGRIAIAKWLYYQITYKGEKYFLNIAEHKDGSLHVHGITEAIK